MSRIPNTSADSSDLTPADVLYLDWAVTNKGPGSITTRSLTALYVDGFYQQAWIIDPPFAANWTRLRDYALGTLPPGTHTLRIVMDYTIAMAEADETDNDYVKVITVSTPPDVADIRISPVRLNINCTSTQTTPGLRLIEEATSPALGEGAAVEGANGAAGGNFAQAADPIPPRSLPRKPQHTTVDDRFERNLIHVKFHDRLPIRVLDGQLTDAGSGVLASAGPLLNSLRLGTWRPVDRIGEAQLESMRQRAQRRLGRALADLTVDFYFQLPAGAEPSAVITALNALDIVELAQPVPRPVPPPIPGNFVGNQGYLNAAPGGLDAIRAWNDYGARGKGIRIIDIEYVFQTNHADLPPVTIAGPTPQFPASLSPVHTNHGTAVLGELAALDNGWGITGTSPGADLYFVGTYQNGMLDVPGALSTAIATARPGDIILLETQAIGPNWSTTSGDVGLVPQEWFKPAYDRIVLATGQDITVVEAGANGYQDLDASAYGTGNSGHWPFLPGNDSGAILVGAGAAPGTAGVTARSRLSFSNHGSAFALQGWGQNVWTLGYGDAYSGEGSRYYYTRFSGTSSATPMVAASCAMLQSAFAQLTAAKLTPLELRQMLSATGSAQQSGANPASQKIGPLPNVTAAILLSFSTQRNFTIFNDGNLALNVTSLALDQPTSWITWSPSAPFTIPAKGSMSITVRVDRAQAPLGQTHRRLLVASDDPDESPYPGGLFITLHKNERPLLLARPSGPNVTISWTTNAADFVLESATDPVVPASWTAVAVTPSIDGNHYTVTSNPAIGPRFYRLRRP